MQAGIRVTQKLIAVDARVLSAPRVEYVKTTAEIRDASWNMMKNQFRTKGMLSRWSYVVLSAGGQENPYTKNHNPKDLISEFRTELIKTGINYSNPITLPSHSVQIRDETDAELLFKQASQSKEKINLLLIILPRKASAAIYGAIKRLGDITYGIATICVDGQKLSPKKNAPPKQGANAQYIANVAMKFNLKLGGSNHFVKFNFPLNETMVVGIDVTHPSPSSSEKAPSVAGMVASVDANLGQWPAILRRQGVARQEMVTALQEMLSTRLVLWRAKNKVLPKNILVYRDGVSEGQYDIVIKDELPLLRNACQELYPQAAQKQGYPHITIIIVGKRHHTRFYPTSAQNATKTHNNRPGTVVDRGVTEARNWDFFLQPHAAIKGTARPIHYFVIHDEIFHLMPRQDAVDRLEALTHNLCYVYGRATKAVSVATPAFYADIVCERARCYLNRLFDDPAPSSDSSKKGGASAFSSQKKGGPSSVGGKSGATDKSEDPKSDDPKPDDPKSEDPKVYQEGITIHPNLLDTMFYI